VAGHVDHVEADAQHLDAVTAVERRAGLRDAFSRRTPDGALQARAQGVDAADMVGVVVRH
jgi:hypothetical protein